MSIDVAQAASSGVWRRLRRKVSLAYWAVSLSRPSVLRAQAYATNKATRQRAINFDILQRYTSAKGRRVFERYRFAIPVSMTA